MAKSAVVATAVPKSGETVLGLDTFRRDFALVWKAWIARNEETPESYQEAGKAVKKNMQNVEWMRGAMSHFAQMADAIRRDLARSERIRAEQAMRRAA